MPTHLWRRRNRCGKEEGVFRLVGAHLDDLRRNGCSRTNTLQSLDHDAFADLQAAGDSTLSIDRHTERHLAVFSFVVLGDDHHVFLVLVGADGALIDSHYASGLRLAHRQTDELTRNQMTIAVVEHGADADS